MSILFRLLCLFINSSEKIVDGGSRLLGNAIVLSQKKPDRRGRPMHALYQLFQRYCVKVSSKEVVESLLVRFFLLTILATHRHPLYDPSYVQPPSSRNKTYRCNKRTLQQHLFS